MSDAKASKRPIHEIRLGRIKAAIWANETREGIRHNISLTRIYRDGDTWKDSSSFGRDDLPLVAKVTDLAHTWIYGHAMSHGGSEGSDTGSAAVDF